MTDLIKDIDAINGHKSQLEKGIEAEKEEHYASILELVLDEDLAMKIVEVIANNHVVKENYPEYYDYLDDMEKQMRWDAGR